MTLDMRCLCGRRVQFHAAELHPGYSISGPITCECGRSTDDIRELADRIFLYLQSMDEINKVLFP